MPDDQELQVALGDLTYRIESPFGAFTQPIGKVTDVATASDGTVFLLTRRDCRIDPVSDCVHVVAPDGRHLASWGGERLVDAHKIAVDQKDRIWIVDRDAHEVVAFDRAGREIMALGRRNVPLAPFNHPTDIAFFRDGGMAVADGYAGAAIHLFSPEGQMVGSFGSLGRGPGQFLVPHGIAAMSDDSLVVADRENGRVQRLSRSGRVLGVFAIFFRPMDVWVDHDDTILVSDAIPTLTRINADGGVLGRCRTTLNGPHGFCGSPDGVLYMAENNPSRLTRVVPVEQVAATHGVGLGRADTGT